MNLDQLKENWQTQMEQSTAGSKLASSESAMQRAKQFERSIWLRDLIESLAAVLVIATFMLFLLFGKAPWLMQFGAGVIIAGAALILIVMNTTRQSDPAKLDAPLVEFAENELKRVNRQIWLLRHITWWYSGPILLGASLFLLGALLIERLALWMSVSFGVSFALCMIFAGYVVHRHNQNGITRELEPIRSELESFLASLHQSEPTNEPN